MDPSLRGQQLPRHFEIGKQCENGPAISATSRGFTDPPDTWKRCDPPPGALSATREQLASPDSLKALRGSVPRLAKLSIAADVHASGLL